MTGRLDLPDFELETYFSRWEFTAAHHLRASDAESMSMSELLALGTDEERAAFDQSVMFPTIASGSASDAATFRSVSTPSNSTWPDGHTEGRGRQHADRRK